jgi:hypothetical protein
MVSAHAASRITFAAMVVTKVQEDRICWLSSTQQECRPILHCEEHSQVLLTGLPIACT